MELENVFKFFDKAEPLLIYTATLREDDNNYIISWDVEKEIEHYGQSDPYFEGNEKPTGIRSTVYQKDIVESFVILGQWIVVEEEVGEA